MIVALGSEDRSLVGGKAAGIGALLRLGLDVPAGFVITRRAFEKCVRVSDDYSLEINIPDDVRKAVEQAVIALKKPLAVRSSATVEDSQASSFAGVFHTELHVMPERVLHAARNCWARAFSPEAVTHALRNNVDPRRIAVPLVVQELVDAEHAGVLFTQDPAGDDCAVLSYTAGSGDRLMQGEDGGKTLRIRDKAPTPFAKEMVKIGRRVEKKLGHPQDIEWAVRDGKIWFLQTRPISTVEPKRGITWTRALSEERFPTPISPLGWSVLQTVLPINLVTLQKRFGLTAKRPDDVARTIRHYVYSNEKFFSIPGSMKLNPFAQIRFWKGYVREGFDFLKHVWRGDVKLLALTRLIRAFLFPHAREIRATWDAHLAGVLRDMDSFDQVDPSTLTLEGLKQHRAAMEEIARRYMEPDLAIYVVKMAASWIVQKLGGDLAGLTAGLARNRTLEMNDELAEVYSTLDEETRALLRDERYDEIEPRGALARWIERNGHMTTNWDMRQPTWGEDPRKVLQMLRSCAQAHRRIDQKSQQEHQARSKAQMKLSPAFAPFFEETLGILHDFMRIDEEHHFYCSRLFRPMRRLYLELGARLVKAGMLSQIDDVWFLTIPEIDGAFANPFSRRELARSRRISFERSVGSRPPDRFLDQKPLVTQAVGGPLLQGVGASPGVATGVVRVVSSPEEIAALQPGEILVTPSPNPAWTPAYAVAGALVTATGSVLSHGLVSAREYHLPAVTGIPTDLFSTGQRVRVDGDRGIVHLS